MQKKNLVMVYVSKSYIADALRELEKVRGSIQSGVSGDTQIVEPVKSIEKELRKALNKVDELVDKEEQ